MNFKTKGKRICFQHWCTFNKMLISFQFSVNSRAVCHVVNSCSRTRKSNSSAIIIKTVFFCSVLPRTSALTDAIKSIYLFISYHRIFQNKLDSSSNLNLNWINSRCDVNSDAKKRTISKNNVCVIFRGDCASGHVKTTSFGILIT